MEQQAFIKLIKDKAIELQSSSVLASITISQAILESGWGTSELFQKANNCFGIKWTDDCGYDKYLITTKEVVNGKEISVQAYFRKYINLGDSIKDHAILLQKDRYKNLIGDTSYKSVANKLYQDGYSTSPQYPNMLIKLIEQYNLASYDNLNMKKEGIKMKIGLRGGHSINCEGAVGIVDEYQQMQKYFVAVKSVFEAYGHTVIDCNSNGSSAIEELSEGANKANSNGCDLFISLHMNCFNGEAHGTEALVSSESSSAYPYAQRLVDNFASLGFTNRGVKFVADYEMNHISCGNIISEICFCDSASDMAIYNQYSWEQLAHVLCNAIDGNIPKEVSGTGSNTTSKVGWNQDNTGWWYKMADGSYPKDCWQNIENEWYSFDSQGYARHDAWIQDKGKWYWLKSDCKMAKSCWLWIDGECYCFGADGSLYVSCVTPDGYTVDANGAWDETIPQKK